MAVLDPGPTTVRFVQAFLDNFAEASVEGAPLPARLAESGAEGIAPRDSW